MEIVSYAIKYADILKQFPGNVSIHGLDLKVIWGNDATLQSCGFRNSDEIYGISYANLPCPAAEEYETFELQDKTVITNKKKITIISLLEYSTGLKLMLGEKKPVFDVNGNMLGIICNLIDIKNHGLIDVSRFLFEKSAKYNSLSKKKFCNIIEEDTNNPCQLSQRQIECLFFLLRGKSAKEIAKILSISPRTVETHFEAIRLKMKCKNKSQIIEKANMLGLFNILPKSLLDKLRY